MSNIDKEFVPYEQALALKQLGFNEPCFNKYYESGKLGSTLSFFNHNYIGQINAPTYSQAFRWFREEYGLDNAVLKDRFVIETQEDLPTWYYGFKTYEEAELACLRKLIEIVKENKL